MNEYTNPPYYLSAYGLAVKHGYTGTEEDWVRETYNNALNSSKAAKQSAEDSEAWAVGQREGEAIPETDPAYHNNAAYHAAAASASAGASAGSASTSEAYGAGTRGGEPVAEGDPAYQNNAPYYAGQADDRAEDAEAWAVGQRDGSDIPSSDPAYHNNSKHYADLAKDYAEDTGGLITATVEAWLDEHHVVVDPENYVIDNSLSTAGEAADAKAAGDAIGDVKSALLASESVPISGFPLFYGNLANNGTWNNVNQNYQHIVIPVSANDEIHWEGNRAMLAAVVTDYTGAVNGVNVPYSSATGFTSKFTLEDAGSDFTIPSDGKYLITEIIYGGSAMPLTAFTVNGYNMLKSVKEHLEAVQLEIEQIKVDFTARDAIPFSDTEGYINTDVAVGQTVNTTPVTGSGFNYIIFPCSAGDVFQIDVKGGSSAKAWAFTDGDYKLISKLTSSNTIVNDKITAPANGYLIVNNSNSYTTNVCYKLTHLDATTIDNRLDVLETFKNDDAATTAGALMGFILNPEEWGVGTYQQTIGSESTYVANNIRRYSPIIKKPYPITVCTDGTYWFTIIETDSNDIVTSVEGQVSDFYTIPPNSRFRIIIANNADPTTDISEDTASEINSAVFIGNEQLAELVNPKNPVRWCAMGDSITEGYYSYIDSENESQSAINRKLTWVPTVSRINKWELTNKGVGGTGWLKKENSAEDDHNTAYYIARHTNYTAFDLVTLAYGINDWKANEQMGTLSDDSSAVTPTTVIQAMKATIEAILSSNPSVKVIGILPLNCAGYDKNYGTKATNWGLGYSFSNTGTLNEFVEALVSVYEYYGIQYVDMAHYSCVNRENLLQALPDGVHPSLEIHKVLASELSKKITF